MKAKTIISMLSLIMEVSLNAQTKPKPKVANQKTANQQVTQTTPFNWNGVYVNAIGGTLTIFSYKKNESFEYKFVHTGKTECGGIELTGIAKF